jgi:hypothetical protein
VFKVVLSSYQVYAREKTAAKVASAA